MVFNLPTSTECVKCDFYHLVQNTHKELFFLNTSPHIIPVLFHMRIILKVFVVSDCLVHLLKDFFFFVIWLQQRFTKHGLSCDAFE